MISRHVIYCDHYPDGTGEAGSNARERKPATVSHELVYHITLIWFLAHYIFCLIGVILISSLFFGFGFSFSSPVTAETNSITFSSVSKIISSCFFFAAICRCVSLLSLSIVCHTVRTATTLYDLTIGGTTKAFKVYFSTVDVS